MTMWEFLSGLHPLVVVVLAFFSLLAFIAAAVSIPAAIGAFAGPYYAAKAAEYQAAEFEGEDEDEEEDDVVEIEGTVK
jgi:hypothetical protein